jgi:hypothetical protein
MTFIGITLTRVAVLASGPLGAGWLGWLFAVGLGAGVYLAAYWMKVADAGTRTAASVTLAFFVLADLAFNNAEVYRHMADAGTWGDWMLRVAGLVYASFPTLAAALLGWLQGRVDRLPPAPMRKGAIFPRIKLWIAAQIDSQIPQSPQILGAAGAPALDAPEAARSLRVYECACGRTFVKQTSFAAHKRHCAAGDSQAAEPATETKEKEL